MKRLPHLHRMCVRAPLRCCFTLSLLSTLMHTGLLGALLTFARIPVCSAGLWGLSPLADQQLAGLVMWMPMGAIYLIGSLIAAATRLAATPSAP